MLYLHLSSIHKWLEQFLDLFIPLSVFIQFAWLLRHIGELAGRCILGEEFFWEGEEEKEEKEGGGFWLLSCLSYVVGSGVGGFPDP